MKKVIVFVFLLIPSLNFAASKGATSIQPSQVLFEKKNALVSKVVELQISEREVTLNKPSSPEQKRRGHAFLRSLLIPGWGEHYAGSKIMSKFFLASEILLWGAHFGYASWGNWLEDDYKAFSVEHAQVNPTGKSDRYFVNIGINENIFIHNNEALRDRNLSGIYRNTEANYWQWDSFENRAEFDLMRIRSDRAKEKASNLLAIIFANHVVSAIHSTYAVYKFNKRLAENEIGMNIEIMPEQDGSARVSIQLSKGF